jgi:hypothetical protein
VPEYPLQSENVTAETDIRFPERMSQGVEGTSRPANAEASAKSFEVSEGVPLVDLIAVARKKQTPSGFRLLMLHEPKKQFPHLQRDWYDPRLPAFTLSDLQ